MWLNVKIFDVKKKQWSPKNATIKGSIKEWK